MGRLQGPSYQGSVGFDGEPKMPRNHRQDTEGGSLSCNFCDSSSKWGDIERNPTVYDVTTHTRQGHPIL